MPLVQFRHGGQKDRRSDAIVLAKDKGFKQLIESDCREIAGQSITLFGLAKGAAMIGPRMATMLGFLFTDASIHPYYLDDLLRTAVDQSFVHLTPLARFTTDPNEVVSGNSFDCLPAFGSGLANPDICMIVCQVE